MRQRDSASWPLAAGAAIVGIVVLLALVGPAIAPRDPLERTLVAEIGGRRLGVPFPPFQSWSFPLGSDRFGRDLFSRLLWAVRPTLLLVTIVAAIRLLLGVLIGAAAGWSTRVAGRALSLLINAALAIPVLLVALAAITAVGIERGLVAFIVGMVLTGWAETAQIVRAQTQLVAARPFVQAARALGANGPQILVRHIGRHLAPLLAMLLAFEISAALLLAAALGFLGYFIGGGVWVILAGEYIPIAERVAGLPELGQLIGTADVRVSSRPPWEMIFPGLAIVVAVLGFSLLGEGLRRRQEHQAEPGRSWLARLLGAAGQRLEERVVTGAGAIDARLVPPLATAAVALAILGGAWALADQGQGEPAGGQVSAIVAQEGWASERGDPSGTLRGALPPDAPGVTWTFQAADGLTGGPAVAPDGTVLIVTRAGSLHALSPDGQERWRTAVAGEPAGGPAIGPGGEVYVVDRVGALHAFTAGGEPLWRFQTSYRAEGTSGPVVGPDGTIYYTVLDGVQAVWPDGAGRWVGSNPDLAYSELTPRVSPDTTLIFLKDSAFGAADGALLPLTIVPDQPRFADPLLLIGANGRTYYRTEHRIVPWRRVEGGVAVQQALGWPANNVLYLPTDAGVTAGGVAWMLYTADFADARLIWIDGEGRQSGQVTAPLRSARVIAVADDATALLCGSARNRSLRCAALSPEAGDEPRWELELGESGAVPRGGAAVGGRIYLTTDDGQLFALE